MVIQKHGDRYRGAPEIIHFECKECGCIFETKITESFLVRSFPLSYKCYCPECGACIRGTKVMKE